MELIDALKVMAFRAPVEKNVQDSIENKRYFLTECNHWPHFCIPLHKLKQLNKFIVELPSQEFVQTKTSLFIPVDIYLTLPTLVQD